MRLSKNHLFFLNIETDGRIEKQYFCFLFRKTNFIFPNWSKLLKQIDNIMQVRVVEHITCVWFLPIVREFFQSKNKKMDVPKQKF